MLDNATLQEPLSLLIYILIAGVILYLVNWFIGMLALPPQIKQGVLLIVGVIGLIWILSFLL